MNEGKIIREIRTAKNLSLKQAAGNDMTASFVAKFERGDSDISLTRFYELLDNLHVSINEYDLYCNRYGRQQAQQDDKEFMTAWQIGSATNIKRIAKRYETHYDKYQDENDNYRYLLFSAIAYAIDNDKTLEAKPVQPVADYLFVTDPWGVNELYLLRYATYVFNHDTMITMSRIIGEAGNNYLSDYNYRHEYMLVINNMVSRLFEMKEYSRAKNLIEFTLSRAIEDDWAIMTRLKFIDSLIVSIVNDDDTVLNQAKQLINIPRCLGFNDLAMKLDVLLRHRGEDMTKL